MVKLAIIGASYLQQPLIRKAKEMGIETHVFAWKTGDAPGEKSADHFYPISIVEKEEILAKCKEIGIDGICTIASDLATVTVNHVANEMGLVGNSEECTSISTNKHLMRLAFEKNGDPSPRSVLAGSVEEALKLELQYPVIVKPTDRSGSLGITKLKCPEGLADAVKAAMGESFSKEALVEEFAEGIEYSVESFSYQGQHDVITITRKYTTGSPHFIETGHIEPAKEINFTYEQIRKIVTHALDSLKITNGASHTELKISDEGVVRIIEIGGRMGGDFIGSDLVYLSTGVDFVRAVIDTALGRKPDLSRGEKCNAAVRFIMNGQDAKLYDRVMGQDKDIVIASEIDEDTEGVVTDSSNRHGYFIMRSDDRELLESYLGDGENG